MQWFMAMGMLRCSKKVTMSSVSFSDSPASDTMTGFLVDAIFSRRTQSLESALATLMMGRSSRWIRSTEASSKGVAMGMQFCLRIASTRTAYSSSDILVSMVLRM